MYRMDIMYSKAKIEIVMKDEGVIWTGYECTVERIVRIHELVVVANWCHFSKKRLQLSVGMMD